MTVTHAPRLPGSASALTIDGRFLTRSLTSRLDIPVLSAVVTVRAAGGEILNSARDSFERHPGE